MRTSVRPAPRLPIDSFPHEVVERKGIGHPDSLADGVAEAVSRAYSAWCLDRFGVIANHWVDKCMLLGGASDLEFGRGRLVRPYRVLVVGKATLAVGAEQIPITELATEAARSYLASVLDGISPERDVVVEVLVNNAVGAGRADRWYQPQDRADLPTTAELTANDAVVCTAFAPLSRTERLVLDLERSLTAGELAERFPETGTDVKVLASRVEDHVDVVACVPFLADRTPSRAAYDRRKAEVVAEIDAAARRACPGWTVDVKVNTRDDEHTVYMTSHGSAADTGDCGVVGRGNRANGLITPMRPMGIEAPAGKNPTYHTGKLYTLLALDLARLVAEGTSMEATVTVTSSTGRPLAQPDLVAVDLVGSAEEVDRCRPEVERLVAERSRCPGDLTDQFVRGTTLW